MTYKSGGRESQMDLLICVGDATWKKWYIVRSSTGKQWQRSIECAGMAVGDEHSDIESRAVGVAHVWLLCTLMAAGYIVFSTVYSTSWTIMFGKLFYKLTRNTQNHIALVYHCQLAVCGHISIPRNTTLWYTCAVDHDQTQLHQEWTAECDSLIPVTKVTWSRCGRICELGLSTRGPTPRGCRVGSRKQRAIVTVVGNIPTIGLQHRTICP